MCDKTTIWASGLMDIGYVEETKYQAHVHVCTVIVVKVKRISMHLHVYIRICT